ncbi:MAG: long-chain fatty acid--CoA ligase [Nakamurella sp.]
MLLANLSDRAASFGQLLLDRVEATPDRRAFLAPDPTVTGGWRSLTWAETGAQVTALAAGLIALGVSVEDRVAIASSTRLEWVLADLGAMCAGGATTTIYPTTKQDDVTFILKDSGSVVIFAENNEQIAKLTGVDLPNVRAIITFDGTADGERILTMAQLAARGRELLADNPTVVTDRVAELTPEHLATLIYTSGTTGKPKGARLVHDNWTYVGAAVEAMHILDLEDVQYLWLPLSHVFGKMLLAVQLTIGFTSAVDGNLDRIVANMAEVKPTFMAGAPRIFEKVRSKVTLTAQGNGGLKAKIFNWAFNVGIRRTRLRQSGSPIPAVLTAQCRVAEKLVFAKIQHLVGGRAKFFISGSAPLSVDVAEWFDAAGMPVLEGYGLTESSAASCVNLPQDYRIGTVGPPLPGTEVVIAADGEILLRGPGIMRGYHNNATVTEGVLSAEGWLQTGDIGELVDGYLKVTDRKKDLIKTSGGKYVAPQKIETVFKAVCPYASQILVHGDGRKFCSALITLDPEAIGDWAKSHGMEGVSFEELAISPAVRALMTGYIDELNTKLEHWETIKKFIVLPRDLSVEEGELTPSMKMRRRAVEAQYKKELDAFYVD